VPFGVVFSTLMAALMLGANVVQFFFAAHAPAAAVLPGAVAGAAASLLVAALAPTDAIWTILFAFCAFEAAVGLYFPLVGTLRGLVVPSAVQATVASIYRIGLNACVIFVLLGLPGLPPTSILLIAVALLAASFLAAITLRNTTHDSKSE
jgi:MFS transporter, MFS domain-containing protein family, molybdate-anion transporter